MVAQALFGGTTELTAIANALRSEQGAPPNAEQVIVLTIRHLGTRTACGSA